jgi:hypothetical protein
MVVVPGMIGCLSGGRAFAASIRAKTFNSIGTRVNVARGHGD